MKNKAFTVNNFDLIRLFAAFQVALHHAAQHLKLEYSNWILLKVTAFLPGVPIFFFISGFLISKSYESRSSIMSYAQNRILRIYPGLIICVFVSILSVWLLGYYETVQVSLLDIGFWFLAQISIFQCYNPSFMRAYGVGTLDGSLWTIGVELKFYVLVPICYVLFGIQNGRKYNRTLITLIAIFLIFNRFYIGNGQLYGDKVLYKLIGISFIPWFYMFLTGVFVQKNFNTIIKYLENRAPIFIILYFLGASIMYYKFHLLLGNDINPLIFFLLIPTLISIAFTKRDLSIRLLKKNDISYGVYIYHMPIVNTLLYIGIFGTIHSLILCLLLSALFATTSWTLIEKPSLMLKKNSLNSLQLVENGG